MWRNLLRRLGFQALLRRPWAPAVAAALVLLTVLTAIAGITVSCSSLAGRKGSDRTGARATEPDIRVRIHKGDSPLTVEGPRPLVLTPSGGSGSRSVAGPLTIACGPGGLSIADGTGGVMRPGSGVGIEIAPGPGQRFRADGTDYPGILLLRARSDDGPESFDGVAVMPVEEYLPGVVAREMPARWPRGAYQVQAVCARTYALHDRDRSRKAGKPFDVESTTLDQVYGGFSTNAVVVEAVQSTRGMAVTWRDGLLRAYYSSTCGGRPSSAAEVWPTGPGFEFNLASPLQGSRRATFCEASAAYSWEMSRTVDDVTQRLKAWGRYAGHGVKNLGKLRSVDVTTSNRADRPVKYRLVDDRGQTFRVTAEELRVACNWPAEGLAPVTRANRINSSDVQVEVRAGQVRFRGRGLGHGVGMCQWCAKGMAEQGQDWKAMIAEFYPGATVERQY